MRTVSQTTQFARDVKRLKRRGKNLEKLKTIVIKLAQGESLESKYHDHPLSGEWNYCRDCHIEPDWVLIYTVNVTSLRLERTGTHADLFR